MRGKCVGDVFFGFVARGSECEYAVDVWAVCAPAAVFGLFVDDQVALHRRSFRPDVTGPIQTASVKAGVPPGLATHSQGSRAGVHTALTETTASTRKSSGRLRRTADAGRRRPRPCPAPPRSSGGRGAARGSKHELAALAATRYWCGSRSGVIVIGKACRSGRCRSVTASIAARCASWRRPLVPAKRAPVSRPAPKLGAYRAVSDSWLVDDRDAPRKQRHTAKRIHERLVDEYGDESPR